MLRIVGKIEEYLASRRQGRVVLGAPARPTPPREERRRLAELVLPVVRGMLGTPERVILEQLDWFAREVMPAFKHQARVPVAAE